MRRIKNGVDGLLVPPSDSKALARAIVELLESPEKARILGINGRRNVATWPDVAKMLEKAYVTASKH